MFGQQWMGTSNYEYWGGAVPEYFALLQKGEFEKAMEIYWRINPARQARVAIQATFAGGQLHPPLPLEVSGLAARLQWRARCASR